MKTIGLVGGTSWVSSAQYYQLLNELVNQRLGGAHFARCILHSFSFGDIQPLIERRDWATLLDRVTEACRGLSAGGAACVMLCSSTTHVIADALRERIDLPLVHIAEATAEAIAAQGLTRVGLLGTRVTMEPGFFTATLAAHGIEAVPPDPGDRAFVHDTIFAELTRGTFLDATRRRYLEVVDALAARGAQGVVLGCTEIPLLVRPADCALPLFDTTRLHAEAGVRFALD